jgi:hypothetical protein
VNWRRGRRFGVSAIGLDIVSTFRKMSTKPDQVQFAAEIVWGVAFFGILLGVVVGYFGIEAAQSAPQQAAGAAMACFYVIAPYVFARAFERLSR